MSSGHADILDKIIFILLPDSNVIPSSNTVTLYDCQELASGCSSCIAAGMRSHFACGWCESSCEVRQECSNSFVIKGDNCPAPVINSFNPISGKNTVSIIIIKCTSCRYHIDGRYFYASVRMRKRGIRLR